MATKAKMATHAILYIDAGLDSTSSMQVLGALRKVSELGLNIVTVLHQPRYEIYELFHDVVLLGVGGHLVYLGPTEGAYPYFVGLQFTKPEQMNPVRMHEIQTPCIQLIDRYRVSGRFLHGLHRGRD